MEVKSGKSVCYGVTDVLDIKIIKTDVSEVVCRCVNDGEIEVIRYQNARDAVAKELEELYIKAKAEIGEKDAGIFKAHVLMLYDEVYNDSIENKIREQKINAEYAVESAKNELVRMFDAIDDELIKARSLDIKDISTRIINMLIPDGTGQCDVDKPVIIAAYELTPSMMLRMNKENMRGLVMQSGTANSHAAILARSMGIPTLINVKIDEEWDGKNGVVDAINGRLYIEPDNETKDMLADIKNCMINEMQVCKEQESKSAVTKDGRIMNIYANISNRQEADAALANGAEGIGLFRTEFLYIEREGYPTEEEQFEVYKYIADRLGEKKVVIRTFDIGADKPAGCFGLSKEINPALGLRGIRLALERKEVFKTQLRAILRAAIYGNLAVMFPMVTSKNEVQEAKRILYEAECELKAEGIPYADVKVGVMIETPAAVIMSDELAKLVDFFSIGTNDLAQYTLAADRQNERLTEYDAHHPAVLRMIEIAAKSAHEAGIKISVCGELASDEAMVEMFLRMGIDEISVSPIMIPSIRKAVRSI